MSLHFSSITAPRPGVFATLRSGLRGLARADDPVLPGPRKGSAFLAPRRHLNSPMKSVAHGRMDYPALRLTRAIVDFDAILRRCTADGHADTRRRSAFARSPQPCRASRDLEAFASSGAVKAGDPSVVVPGKTSVPAPKVQVRTNPVLRVTADDALWRADARRPVSTGIDTVTRNREEADQWQGQIQDDLCWG
jgi:hypothetical protein